MFSQNKYNWSFDTEPIPTANHRRLVWPKGKTLGGSSAINGMVFTRGIKHDYDRWLRDGNEGWGWDDVLPAFKRMEHNSQSGDLVGIGGSQKVSDPAVKPQVLFDFIEAASQSCDVPVVANLSAEGLEGAGMLQASIWQGQRHSTYDGYVRPIEGRENLTIVTGAHVTRLVIEGDRVVGVDCVIGGKARRYTATKEVILSAGSIGSPHILMLSGVGDADDLKAHGIDSKLHLPGVGKNLQDHFSTQIKASSIPSGSHNRRLRGWRKYAEGVRYVFNRSGYLACSATLAGALVKSAPNLDHADLDIGFRPVSMSITPSGEVSIDDFDALSLQVFVSQPKSRGCVELKSADPMAAPLIQPNYLSDPQDMATHVRGVRICRKILSTNPLAKSLREEVFPGANLNSDAELSAYIRSTGKTSFHAVGTCRMGHDGMAVVDSRLRVHGLKNLRVIDASIMPTVTSANTNAPTLMIGEMGVEMILRDSGQALLANASSA